MVISQLSGFHRVAHDNSHESALMHGIEPHSTNNAMENHAHEAPRAESRAAAPPNPSPFYRTYLDPNIQLLADQVYFQPKDDGYTYGLGIATAHNVSISDAQAQAPDPAAAYKLAARLADRSNGAPLATIIEQGSYSTLNSHGSLLSVGRFPSTKAAETTSPIRGSRRRSRSLDGKALHDIEEDMSREYDVFEVAVPQARPNEDPETADPASGTATPLTSCRFEVQRSTSSSSIEELLKQDDPKAKGFIRGVLQNMRGVSRARSRSSSLSCGPIVERRDSLHSTSEAELQSGQQHQSARAAYPPRQGRGISNCPPEGAANPMANKDQTRSRITPFSSIELSAWAHLPQIPSRSAATTSGHGSDSLPSVFPYLTATCALERPVSTSVVHAETRDVAPKDGTVQAAPSCHDMFEYTFDGIPVYRRDLSSDHGASSARDVFTNQNASFCSTMSTSYSGTVLGVDLDLQHDFSRSIRRSQSPPEPVWFTPQMAELERQAFSSGSTEFAANQAPCHSITSSALTSLLPIAAASGIVQPNYNTPTISFYSPSGNLIQPESSPSRCTSPSEGSGSSTITTSYYNRRICNTARTTRTQPTRPLLLPMTTPPTQRTPLPLNLRHHHNYRHPELSHIGSDESYVTPKGPVKGCDGVVREDSLTPRSGVFFSHGKDKIHRSTKLVIHDLKAEAKFYKTRFLARAAAQSFAPSIPKGKTVKECRLHSYDSYARKPQINKTEPREGRFGVDALGPLAAHALRVCFCQPYDGAGTSTHVFATRARVTRRPFTEHTKSEANQRLKEAEHLLPNARVAGRNRNNECRDAKKSSRRNRAFRTAH